jgi:disulfide bond formation protein DsbB
VSPLVRLGNAAAAAGIAAILLVAFGLQFGLNEPPCPLCTLQRAGFVLCGFGFMLNLRFGVQPLHYGLALLGALFGVVASGYAVLQHIGPGAVAHGSPLGGMHLDTWSLVLFFVLIVVVALLLIASGRPDHDRSDHQTAMRFRGFPRFAAYLLIAVTLANAVSSLAQCGPTDCSGKQTGYWIARYLQ